MKMDKEMQQVECGDEPSPHVEGDSQPGADVAVLDEAKALEEEKSVEGEGSMDDDADNVNSAKDAAKPKGVDAEEETGSQLGGAAVDPANKANGISVTSKGKKDAGENEVAEMEVEKLENGDGHAKVTDSEKGSVPKVEGDSDGDNNDVNGEKQLLLASAGEDEDPVLSKLASSSFMFDYNCGGDDSGTEEEQAAFMKELERFYREKLMEFKPPKFYGEGLNCLKLWRQVTGLGGYDQGCLCC